MASFFIKVCAQLRFLFVYFVVLVFVFLGGGGPFIFIIFSSNFKLKRIFSLYKNRRKKNSNLINLFFLTLLLEQHNIFLLGLIMIHFTTVWAMHVVHTAMHA